MRAAPGQTHELIKHAADATPDATALISGEKRVSYAELMDGCRRFASGVIGAGLPPGGRIGVYLPKQVETVIALFGTSAAGGTFVPINPVLRSRQVAHIVADCDVRYLVTSKARWADIRDRLAPARSLEAVILIDDDTGAAESAGGTALLAWPELLDAPPGPGHRRIDADMAAIVYTSGSTGKPRGVVLSHRNLIAGAESVATYLGNTREDVLLAVLPLSFDAGFSQLTTAFAAGATAVLLDYLLPGDVLQAIDRFSVTGLTAVPPLWNHLVRLDWPAGTGKSLRYIANTGGALPTATTKTLQKLLPTTDIFLMYGLTEAFRSTYLPPGEIDRIPNSIGRAIPNAEVLVINAKGEICEDDEPGELVHRGALVAMGYWNNPEATALRFRPAPGRDPAITTGETAVWSGDLVVRDGQGFLYFLGRRDSMIKTSGYRVSPTEIEEIAYSSGLVREAAAIGLPHPLLGQAILLAISAAASCPDPTAQLAEQLRLELPRFMQPQRIVLLEDLPHNQNGKIDRNAIADEHASLFAAGD
jgi:acyl-CoA ligase (AMP-forming) (exosortase A-associated)